MKKKICVCVLKLIVSILRFEQKKVITINYSVNSFYIFLLAHIAFYTISHTNNKDKTHKTQRIKKNERQENCQQP